jgi:hypothetical protein
MVKDSNLNSQEFKVNTGGIKSHYKTEDLEKVLADFTKVEKAPEGWTTILNYLKNHNNFSARILNQLVNESAITSQEYRDKMGHIRSHYKTEDLDKLVADHKNKNN